MGTDWGRGEHTCRCNCKLECETNMARGEETVEPFGHCGEPK